MQLGGLGRDGQAAVQGRDGPRQVARGLQGAGEVAPGSRVVRLEVQGAAMRGGGPSAPWQCL